MSRNESSGDVGDVGADPISAFIDFDGTPDALGLFEPRIVPVEAVDIDDRAFKSGPASLARAITVKTILLTAAGRGLDTSLATIP